MEALFGQEKRNKDYQNENKNIHVYSGLTDL